MMDNAGRGFGSASFGLNQAGEKLNETFVGHWADSSAKWSVRRGLGEAVDKALGLQEHKVNALDGPSFSTITAQKLKRLNADKAPDVFVKQHPKGPLSLTYSDIFRANTKHVAWKDLTWNNYWNQVKENTSRIRRKLQPGKAQHFFDGFRLRDYARYTLWEENVRPIKTLLSSGWRTNLFTNVAYTAGIGTISYGILSTTRQAYHNAKSREDGTFKSRLNTWKETGDAFIQKTAKSLASWELANVGMVLGKMLIPIGAFPLGGIVVGALMGTVAYSLLDKLCPEPKRLKAN